MKRARLDEEALHHMFGYVEESLHQGTDLHVLGYLDTPQWIDALSALPMKFRPSLLDLAKKVDRQYNTSFHDQMVAHLTEIGESPLNLAFIKEWVSDNRPDLKSSIDELIKQDSFIFLVAMGFEAGRKFQSDMPEFPLGPQSYL